jgi:hypothetical protein
MSPPHQLMKYICGQSDHSMDHQLVSGDHSASRMHILPSQNESGLRSKFTQEGSRFRQMKNLYLLRCRTHVTQPPFLKVMERAVFRMQIPSTPRWRLLRMQDRRSLVALAIAFPQSYCVHYEVGIAIR